MRSLLFILLLPLIWNCSHRPKSTSNTSGEAFKQQIGHIVLQVADLEKSKNFYTNIMNLKLNESPQFQGRTRLMLSGTDEHHELVLMEAQSARNLPKDSRWLQQLAFEVSSREELIDRYKKLEAENISFELKDNQVAWSLYFQDPDGVKIEVYWDVRDQPFGEQMWQGKQEDLPAERLMQ